MKEALGERFGTQHVWDNVVVPQLQHVVVATLRAAEGVVEVGGLGG